MGDLYTPQFKLRVAKEAVQAKSYSAVARNYDVGRDQVRRWAEAYRQYGDLAFEPDGPERYNRQKIEELERRNRDLEEENEILKKAMAFFSTKNR